MSASRIMIAQMWLALFFNARSVSFRACYNEIQNIRDVCTSAAVSGFHNGRGRESSHAHAHAHTDIYIYIWGETIDTLLSTLYLLLAFSDYDWQLI